MLTLVEQLSVAVGRPVFAGSSEVLHSTIALVGQVRTGGIVSSTVNFCVASPKLPHPSVTRHTPATLPGHPTPHPLSAGRAQGEGRWSSVADGNRLHGIGAVAAGIHRGPTAGDHPGAAASVGDRIAEAYNHRTTTILGRCRAGGSGRSARPAFHHGVGR